MNGSEMGVLIETAKYHDAGAYGAHAGHAKRSADILLKDLKNKYSESDLNKIDRTRFYNNFNEKYIRNKEVALPLLKTSYQMQELRAKQNFYNLAGTLSDSDIKFIENARNNGTPFHVITFSYKYSKSYGFNSAQDMINKWMQTSLR